MDIYLRKLYTALRRLTHLHYFLAFLFFSFLVFYLTFPLLFHIGDLVTGYGDELVIGWIQNWVIHTIRIGTIFSLFTANLYYPFHNSFAYSDAFITSSLLSYIPLIIFKQPIAVVNSTLLSSLIFLGFSLYLLAYYLTKDFLASLLAGTLVICSPAVLDKVVHLQILAIYWVPLSILFFLLFIQRQKTKYLIGSLLCFLLQTYNSFVPGYFIAFSYIIITAYFFMLDNKKIRELFIIKNIVLVLVCFCLIIPISIPYYQVSHEFHYVRDIRETIHFALQPEDLLYPGGTTRLQQLLLHLPFIKQTSLVGELKPGYLGLVFTLLAILTFWMRIKYFRKNVYITLFCIIASVGLLLSFGPALHLNRQTVHIPFLIPLPYALLYYLVPGFKGIRDSERWEMLFILAIAVAIAIVLQQFVKNFSKTKKVFLYILLFAGVIGEFNFPMHFKTVPQINTFPKVYSWLATTPKDTNVIFMPIYNWDQFPYTQQEIWREYYSTIEYRNMVNGYSGFSPPPWQALVKNLYTNFPDKQSILVIKKLGIKYIIVNKNQYDILYNDKQKTITGDEIIDMLEKNTSLKLVKQFGEDYVFSF